MSRDIGVWLNGSPAGLLSLAAGRLCFQYRADWLRRPDALPISLSLPLQSEPFLAQQCRPYFAGLLPEGALRRLVAQHCQVSSSHDFALLDALGGECAGAVTLLPSAVTAGQLPLIAEQSRVEWLDEGRVAQLLDELPRRPMLAGAPGLRATLSGTGHKLPVVFDGERVGLPLGGEASTHVLKLQSERREGALANEAFCLVLARSMGLAAVPARLQTMGARQVLLLGRYDRVAAQGGAVERLHQEDFCQALGVAPETRYQREGGPGLEACFALLRRATRPSAPQVLKLVDSVIFNALIGNDEAHAKNFSLVTRGGAVTLAPLYDVLSTAVYDAASASMAMDLGGEWRFERLQASHWERFAQAASLSKAQTRKRVRALSQSLLSRARELQSFPPFAGESVIDEIVGLIGRRAGLATA